MILAIIGYILGIVLLYWAWTIHCRRSSPPSQAEIDLLRVDAAKANGFDRELKFMFVTDAEVQLRESREPNWKGWIVTMLGIALINLSTWYLL